jgi:hypothetical protein
MARARRPEGITEDEHRVLHGELEEAGAVGGAVRSGRGGAGARSADAVVAARRPVRDPVPRLCHRDPDLRGTSAGPVLDRASSSSAPGQGRRALPNTPLT